jgi:hypothetical protein
MAGNTDRVRIAAALGHPAALAVATDAAVELPTHYRSRIETAVAPLSRKEKVRFAIECAERVLHFWNEFDATDGNPSKAITLAQLWTRDVASKDEVERAGTLASESSVRAQMAYDKSENLKSIDQASPFGQAAYRALWAASLHVVLR